jgi:choice-of-anchor C domain-containing protein
MRRLAVTIALVSSIATQRAGAQNLLSNGSFENPALTPTTTFITLTSGQTMGAWTITAGSVDLIRTYWAPADGFQSLDMSGSAAGTIGQVVTTTTGSTYTLRFSMAGNPDGAIQKSMRVWWGTQLLGTFTFDQTGQTKAAMGWQTVTLTGLIAGTTTTLLQFESLTPGATGMALDNVILTLVPEPASALLFATGLFGAGLLIVCRRHAALRAAQLRCHWEKFGRPGVDEV